MSSRKEAPSNLEMLISEEVLPAETTLNEAVGGADGRVELCGVYRPGAVRRLFRSGHQEQREPTVQRGCQSVFESGLQEKGG